MPLCAECREETEYSLAANSNVDEDSMTCSRCGKPIE
jgi:hypothetical protein